MKDAKDILSLSVPDFLDLYDKTQKNILDLILKMFESIKGYLKKRTYGMNGKIGIGISIPKEP